MTTNQLSFCDYCENYFDTVTAYTTEHADGMNGISCDHCLSGVVAQLYQLGEIVSAWRE